MDYLHGVNEDKQSESYPMSSIRKVTWETISSEEPDGTATITVHSGHHALLNNIKVTGSILFPF